MNATSTTPNGRNTLQNLRLAKVAAKPAHVALFAAVQNMVSFAVRAQNCDKTAVTATQTKSAPVIQKINEKGAWCQA